MESFSLNGSWEQESSKDENFHITGDPLSIIYNEGTWRLNKVSPLYKLQYRQVKLKMTGAKIKQAIVSIIPTAKYTVAVEELPYLKYSENDASALMIKVSSINKAKSKDVYTAVLLSWGVYESVKMAIHLPYMLERGVQNVGMVVKSTLQKLYDCSIKQFTFTQNQILQFGFSFVDCSASRSTDPFTLRYTTPQLGDEFKSFDVTFDIGGISTTWNRMKDDSMQHSDLVTITYQQLQNLIYYTMKIDITIFELREISLPKAEVKYDGVVKMMTPELVNSVFTVLNEISNISTVDISSVTGDDSTMTGLL